jgi:hypothetical protein
MSGRSCQVPAFALFMAFQGRCRSACPYEPRPVNSLEADGHKVGLHCRFEISILAKRMLVRKGGSGGEVSSPSNILQMKSHGDIGI